MPVGRNDPCPCGSGLKYKKCHLALDDAARPVVAEAGRSTLHDLDNRFVERVMRWSAQRFGEEMDPELLERSFPEVAGAGIELFVPWVIYHFRVRGLTAFEWYARENDSLLSRRERDWIEAQRRSWLGVWEVRESVPGKSILLADLLTGEQRLVQEASASRCVVARDAILARVVDLGADSILVGTHRRPLPPFEAAEVADELCGMLRAKLPLPVDRLRGEDTVHALIRFWHEAVEERDEKLIRPPQLQNTDGDPLRLLTGHYRFIEASRSSVEAALTSIRGAGEIEAEDDGTSVVMFRRRGNRMHAHWDNTVIGTAFVTADGELRLETNSLRRAAALRKKVETACRGLLTGHRRSEMDPQEGFGAEGPGEADDSAEVSGVPAADYDALVREEKNLHYATWPDRPLPILGNKTPRQASRSRRGREELVVLLKDIENQEARQPASTRFDVGLLRRALGIEE